MSDFPYRTRARSPRRRRGALLLRVAIGLVLLGGAFALGVALGEALDDSPKAGVTRTYVRTLEPLPQRPP